MKIKVTYTGQGSSVPRTTREYAGMAAAEAASWQPVGTASARRLFHAAIKKGGIAQYERNIVEIIS